MTALSQITKPAHDLYALETLKDLVGIQDLTTFDAELFLWMRSATDWVERYTRHTLRESRWRATLGGFPTKCDHIELPLFPVLAVNGIQYRDTSGNLQTWGPSNYIVIADSDPAAIYAAPGKRWPVTQLYRPDSVLIDFTAGYELQTDDTYAAPDAMSLAVQSFVRDRWNRRNRPANEQREETDEPADVVVKAMLEPLVRVPALSVSTPNQRS